VTGTSNDNARDVPDVALQADPPYVFMYADTDDAQGNPSPTQSTYLIRGTSFSAPCRAGFSRLLQTANGGKRLGSLNPVIWELGKTGQEVNGFHGYHLGQQRLQEP
jgi:hypothetical protein